MGHIIYGKNVSLETVHRTRHHLLYPRRVWTEAGEAAQYIRGMFIVKLPEEFHRELHREVDPRLAENIELCHLPPKKDIERMAKQVKRNESYLTKMTPIGKLLWLWTKIPDIDNNEYFKALIAQEITFLRSRKGEY